MMSCDMMRWNFNSRHRLEMARRKLPKVAARDKKIIQLLDIYQHGWIQLVQHHQSDTFRNFSTCCMPLRLIIRDFPLKASKFVGLIIKSHAHGLETTFCRQKFSTKFKRNFIESDINTTDASINYTRQGCQLNILKFPSQLRHKVKASTRHSFTAKFSLWHIIFDSVKLRFNTMIVL